MKRALITIAALGVTCCTRTAPTPQDHASEGTSEGVVSSDAEFDAAPDASVDNGQLDSPDETE